MSTFPSVRTVSLVRTLVIAAVCAYGWSADVAVNFQPATAPVPVGFVADSGAAFSELSGRGWVREDSLTSGQHVPLDLTPNTRDRNRNGIAQEFDTLIHLAYPSTVVNPTAVRVRAAWETVVANGLWQVTAAVGDQPNYDSSHVLRVEGMTAVDQFDSTSALEYHTATVEVIVRDGRLTVDSSGGTNTKLCWLTATALVVTPPDPVSDLSAVPGDAVVTLSWTSVAGTTSYRLHRSASLPVDTSSGVTLTIPQYLDTGLVNGTTCHYVIETINAGDLRSFSAPVSATPQVPLVQRRINFQPAAAAVPPGYEADTGAAFTEESGSGWVRQDSLGSGIHVPLALTPNTRDRNTTGLDDRLDTIIHLQYPLSINRPTAVKTPAAWELTVPTGRYEVTVGVGDQPIDSVHVVRVEGIPAINAFVSTPGNRYQVATIEVEVSDGRLTLDAIGGSNTKLAYVDIAQLTAGEPPGAPAGLFAGAKDTEVRLTWQANAESDLMGYHVYRATSASQVLTAPPVTSIPLAMPVFVDVGLEIGETYFYAVRAVDVGGMSAPSAVIEVTTGLHPAVAESDPMDGATNVPRNVAITCGVALVNPGGVEPSSLTTAGTGASVVLERVSDGAQVPGVANTSGGRDSIVFQPSELLDALSTYRFTVSPGVIDEFGATFAPCVITFTTGLETSIPSDPRVAFARTAVVSGPAVTSLTIGPDGLLYGTALDGILRRWPILADGTLGPVESNPTFAGLALIGLVFDPLAPEVLWLTVNQSLVAPAEKFSSRVVRATIGGPGFTLEAQDYLVGLPRSARDHLSNSLAFGPDGYLYLTLGSNSATGAPDGPWYYRDETQLSASILRIDPRLSADLPLNVRTQPEPAGEGVPYVGYDPLAPGAPVTLHATGIRNAYDLLWHSNGQLYSATNGSAAGGNTPASPFDVVPMVPGLTRVGVQDDHLYRIEGGGYYGHPNPARGQYVLNGGNPTAEVDPAEVVAIGNYSGYPIGTMPDANYRGYARNLGRSRSPNGTIEYRSPLFGGALTNRLLIVEYSGGDGIIGLAPAVDGTIPHDSAIHVVGGLNDPLDLVEDQRNGNLYVCELFTNGVSGRISLLRPTAATGIPTIALLGGPTFCGNAVVGGRSSPVGIVVGNNGDSPLVIPPGGLTFAGADAPSFALSGEIVLPLTIAPGSDVVLPVVFTPTRSGPLSAQLVIASNDPYANHVSTVLKGLAAQGLGGSDEPSLQWILNALTIPLDVGDDDPATNAMPETFPLGEELGIQTFVRAGSDPVSVETLAVFGPSAGGVTTTCGWYWAGAANGIHDLFTVDAANAQRVLPTVSGATTFDPGLAPFSLYSRWPFFNNRMVYGEDAINAFDVAVPHHVRTYALKNADGSVVPDAYLLAFEEHTSGRDWQDLVVVLRGVAPAPMLRGALTVANQEVVPFTDRVAFSRIGSVTAPPANGVHDRATVRLSNSGTGTLVVSEVVINGPWQIDPAVSLPSVLAAGGFVDLPLRFIAGGPTRFHQGTLTIFSSDPVAPAQVVQLAGFWQRVSEGGQEPTVSDVVQVYGYDVVITRPGENINGRGTVQAIGDEVLSQYWRRADTTRPISARQLAAYHSYPATASLRWFAKGSPTVNTVFTHLAADGQTLLPRRNNNTVGSITFTPAAAVFGLAVDGEKSDWLLNNATPDLASGALPPAGHHVRFWPVRDREGGLLPHTWLMMMDYSGINYDYNDNMYLVSNITPEDATLNPLAPAPLPGAPPVVLEFDQAYAGTVLDADGEGTGFTTTQPNGSDRPGVVSSYQPTFIALTTSDAGALELTTAAGGNTGNINSQVNALRLPFNATVVPFRITTRLLAPLVLTVAGQQAGIQLELDRDTFVTLTVGVPSGGGAPVLRFTGEHNQTTISYGAPVALPADLVALTLTLTGDPATGRVIASYQADTAPAVGSGTDLPTAVVLTGTMRERLFASRAWATLLACHGTAASATTVRVDRFAVEADEPVMPAGVAHRQSPRRD